MSRLRTLAAAATAVALTRPLARNDSPNAESRRPALGQLLRAYLVYSVCSVPALVDRAPSILAACAAVPGLAQLTDAVVRRTFYAQFVGGDSARDTLPLLAALRARRIGVLLAYSVEVDEAEATGTTGKAVRAGAVPPHKARVEETLRCIDVAADFEGAGTVGRKTWVAVKLTALVPTGEPLRVLSTHLTESRPTLEPPIPHPGHPRDTDLALLESRSSTIAPEDVRLLTELRDDLVTICTRAQERGVRIIVDAEYSWYQPAIDAYTLFLMRKFNKPSRSTPVQPLIYATFQAYLRRTPAQLARALANARAGGYGLGVKLVRGAYHPHELAYFAQQRGLPAPAAASDAPTAELPVPTTTSESLPPVWERIADTDAAYFACVDTLLAAVAADARPRRSLVRWLFGAPLPPPRVGVLFGTHHAPSCERILAGLVQTGLAREGEEAGVLRLDAQAAERVAIGQLYGMCDWLTNDLVVRVRAPSPFVIKYVPYGELSEVVPYLSRRAIENKSVLGGRGGATEERARAGALLRKRFLGS